MNKKPPTILRLALGLAALCLCMFILKRFLADEQFSSSLSFLYLRGAVFFFAGAILLASLSVGLAVLRVLRIRPQRAGAAALFGLALGLGITSTATLILGAIGRCSHLILALMLLILLALGLSDLRHIFRSLRNQKSEIRNQTPFILVLWSILILFLILNLTRSFMPPYEYDSLEYHLAAPAAWHRAQRVTFLADNVYSNFPQNAEILTFLGMQLTHSPDTGAIVGQILYTVMGFLAALALYQMLRSLAGKQTGLIAAAFFYTWPGVTIYSGNHYVALPLIFYSTLAVWALTMSVLRKRTRPGPRGWTALAGIAAGLALGTKYTAALLVVAPLLGWILFTTFKPRIASKEILRRAALFMGVAVLCFSPWLIRNAINTRNPVYPLAYNLLGSSNWTPQKDARWTRAHSPRELTLSDMAEQAKDVILFNQHKPAPMLFIFIPFCLLVRRRNRAFALALAAHLAGLFLLYYIFTQHNSRFLDLWIPLLAALSALGLGALLRLPRAGILRPLLIFFLLFAPSRTINYFHTALAAGVAAGAETQETALRSLWPQGFGPYTDMQFINDEKNLPPGSKILFIGEAQTYYCRRAYLAPTVFDTHPLEAIVSASATSQDIRDKLKAAGITHLYINTSELCRLQNSYAYPFKGRDRLGMLDQFDWHLFDRFAGAHLNLIKTFRGSAPSGFPWSRWDDFRASWQNKRPLAPHFTALYELR